MDQADEMSADLREALDRLALALGAAQPTLMLAGDQLCLSFELYVQARDVFEALEDVCGHAQG